NPLEVAHRGISDPIGTVPDSIATRRARVNRARSASSRALHSLDGAPGAVDEGRRDRRGHHRRTVPVVAREASLVEPRPELLAVRIDQDEAAVHRTVVPDTAHDRDVVTTIHAYHSNRGGGREVRHRPVHELPPALRGRRPVAAEQCPHLVAHVRIVEDLGGRSAVPEPPAAAGHPPPLPPTAPAGAMVHAPHSRAPPSASVARRTKRRMPSLLLVRVTTA